MFKPAISLLEQVKVIIVPLSVFRVARGVHGHQAIVFLQLHISTVDREVHHSKSKTTPFLFEAGRPARGACTCAHTAPTTQISIVCSYYSAGCSCARARKRTCAWTGTYICSECACVRVCAQLNNFFYGALLQTEKNEWNKCKNHFNEMKGDVGMSLHEKEGNKKNLHQADNPSLHLCS